MSTETSKTSTIDDLRDAMEAKRAVWETYYDANPAEIQAMGGTYEQAKNAYDAACRALDVALMPELAGPA